MRTRAAPLSRCGPRAAAGRVPAPRARRALCRAAAPAAARDARRASPAPAPPAAAPSVRVVLVAPRGSPSWACAPPGLPSGAGEAATWLDLATQTARRLEWAEPGRGALLQARRNNRASPPVWKTALRRAREPLRDARACGCISLTRSYVVLVRQCGRWRSQWTAARARTAAAVVARATPRWQHQRCWPLHWTAPMWWWRLG